MKQFKITKIGLLNFWYYDSEEINFSDGKLLLRGGNGSGKSVTMQSFIPLILDGNKLPSRLDPFGTKEKRIEDYILGPSDSEQKEDAISYLYMETYNEEKNKYITIGMGFHARKGRPTDFWGFSLNDNKRIGIDFYLYKDYGGKVLLTKNELRARLSSDCKLVDTQKEYKAMVNDLLFGFENTDSYDEFINVLLQLRSSKLSKEYTPTKLMDTLTRVLQPLTLDDLRPLSEAIEDTNKTKEQIDTLKNQLKSLNNFLKTYNNYNEIILYNKANNVNNLEIELNNIQNDINSKEKLLNTLKQELEEDNKKYIELEIENNKANERISAISETDLERHTKSLEEVNEQINDINIQIKTYEEILSKKMDKRINLESIIKKYDDEAYKSSKDNHVMVDDIIELCEDIKLNDINVELNKIAHNEEVNFTYLIERLRKYKAKLNEIKVMLEEKESQEISLNNKQEEYEKVKKTYQHLEEEINKLNQTLTNKIINFKDEINNLNNKNQMIILDEECRIKIFELIDNYTSSNYIKARDIYNKISYEVETSNIEEKTKIQEKIKQEDNKLQELNEELERLKNNEELDYIVDEEQIDTYNTLNNLNIPFIPLYKAIEFKDNIHIEEENHLEELLDSMHILNALIVPNKYLDRITNLKGIFLKKTNKKNNNLLKYFNICNTNIDKEEITNILESISIDDNNTSYINDNKYQLDFIIGYPGNNYKSKYIGLLKRRQEQLNKINNLNDLIKDKVSLINNYKNIISSINNKLETLKLERTYFPVNNEIEEILKSINNSNIELNRISNLENTLSTDIINITKNIENIIININNLKNNILIPLNLASYNKAINNSDVILNNLFELKSSYISYLNLLDLKKLKENELTDNEEEIADTRDNLSSMSINLNKLNSRKDIITEILNDKAFKDKIEELKSLRKRLNEIPKEKELISLNKGKKEEKCVNISNELEIIKNSINNKKLVLDLKRFLLEKEYNLGYVSNIELDIKKIIKELSNHKDDDIKRAQANYFQALNDYRNDLLDYRLSNKEIFNENDTFIDDFINRGLNREEVVSIINESIRYDVTAIYQGKSVNMYNLYQCINETINDSEAYITTQERHLFEDILLKTVGRKIRDRINESKNWVKKMNDIMNITGENSNLSFQLEWKNKLAYTEEELDTKELVRLFQIDSGALDRKDSDKLIKHFRSKIKQEMENDEVNRDNYTNIIFNVLDYRNWFEFKIYYKRKFSEKKELTNKIFSVLSGGERAKSMYIPLFAAVYSKLESANDDALRIIALDEAFAGVDNDNIKELFDILGRLNLDYILTSQALWGDYSTIKDLSICELIKDEKTKTVAILKYHWNGYIKEILESDING